MLACGTPPGPHNQNLSNSQRWRAGGVCSSGRRLQEEVELAVCKTLAIFLVLCAPIGVPGTAELAKKLKGLSKKR